MTTITMPQLGESVSEGTILQWLVKEGDEVAVDQSLCEIETEKVNAEMPSPYAGKVEKLLVAEGETVKVGVPLMEIAVTGEAPAQPPAAATPATKPEERPGLGAEQEKLPAAAAAASGPPRDGAAARPAAAPRRESWAPGDIRGNGAAGDRSRHYSPAVLRLAEEHKLDLGQIKGSGIGGRVTRKDVIAFVGAGGAAAAPAPAPVGTVEAQPAAAGAEAVEPTAVPARQGDEVRKLSSMRRTIGERMRQSIIDQPQAWMMVEVDMTKLAKWRQAVKDQFREREGVDLTFLPFVVKATVQGLKQHPLLNSQFTPDGILVKGEVNIGIAVSTEEGLIVPVIKGADGKSIAGLAREISELARKARSRKLAIDDVTGGTFTVDNTGAFGSIASAPIVNPPQAAILSSEMVVKKPVVLEDDSIAVRHMMNMCISFDHRVVDGADIGGFMKTVKDALQSYGPDTPLY
jgi:2-oxoisovalerate dehydrogenase E2 component (dihydrolipoyl transacylase)